MADIRRITESPSIGTQNWLELPDCEADEFLSHLQRENDAFDTLRIALQRDFEDVRQSERQPEWLDALT